MTNPVVATPNGAESKLRSAKVLVRTAGMNCWAVFDPENMDSTRDAFWFSLHCAGEADEIVEIRCSLLFAEYMRHRAIGARLRSLTNPVPVEDEFANLQLDLSLEGVTWTIKTKEGYEFEYWMRGAEKRIRQTPDSFKGNLQPAEGE